MVLSCRVRRAEHQQHHVIHKSLDNQAIYLGKSGMRGSGESGREIKVMKLMFDDSRKAIKQNYEEVYSVYDPGVDEGGRLTLNLVWEASRLL